MRELVLLSIMLVLVTTKQSFSQKQQIDEIIGIADSLSKYEKSYNKAISLYDSAFAISCQSKVWGKALECIIGTAYSYIDLNEYAKAIKSIERQLPNIWLQEGIDTFLYGKALITLALSYRLDEDYYSALKSYEKAITIFDSKKYIHKNVAYAYKNAAQCLIRIGDYQKSINYLNAALKSDTTDRYASSIYSQLSNCYFYFGQSENVYKYAHLTLKSNPSKRESSNAYCLLANIYLSDGEYEKAKDLLYSAIDYYRLYPDYYWENLIHQYIALAKLYATKKDYKSSEHAISKAKQFSIEYSGGKNRESARLYCHSGEFYFNEIKNLPQALTHYQKALIQIFPNFNSTDLSDNPDIEDVYTESWIMTASARKGEALMVRYKTEKNTADLTNAAECFDLSLAGIQALKDSYGSDKAKLYLGDYSHDYFEQAVEVNYLLFEKTGDIKYLEKAFSIMERAKASVLEEGVQKNRGLILAGLPDSLLSEEENLRFSLTELDNRIKSEELKEAEKDDAYISKLRSQYVDQQRGYESLLEYLKAEYPSFRDYIRQPDPPGMDVLQNKLRDRGAGLLEYFMGERHLYYILLLPDGAYFLRTDRTENTDQLIDSFLDYFKNSRAILNDADGFSENAHQLYSFLFPENIRGKLPQYLVIIPSGNLNYVPFDALLPKRISGGPFSMDDFLIKKHVLNFHYSAGLWANTETIASENNLFLNISPLFKNNERRLAPLTSGEIKFDHFKNIENLKAENATLSAFMNLSGKTRFIHFSTHAGMDESMEAARVEFIDTALYISDLYAMKIPAELVTLSACETGLGKDEKGEGVMSLARGFAYSGTANLTASLWQVNEKSTADIFRYFYKNIADGMGKAEALQKARMQYFENVESDLKKSPYYWAGFILIGDNEPVELGGGIPRWVWGLLIICFIPVIFMFRRKKKA